MNFDFLGQLIGKAARRKLEADAAKKVNGLGPVAQILLPAAAALLQQKANDAEAAAISSALQKLGLKLPGDK